MELLTFIVVALVVVGLGVGLGAAARRERRARGDVLGAWATARGWTVVPTDPSVAGLRCPAVEHGGESRFVVHGVDGANRPVVAFEWSYVESTGGDSSGGGIDG